MLNPIKQLAKQSFIYTLGSIVQSAVAVLLIPLYTRYLGANSYGVLEIANTALSVVMFLLSLGFASSLLKNYALDLQAHPGEQKQLIGTAFLSLMPFVLICELLLVMIAPFISHVLFGDRALVNYVYILLVTSFFAIFVNMGFAVLRAKEASTSYTIFFLLRFGALLVCNVVAVAVLKAGVEGILIGNLITYVLAALLLLPAVIRASDFSFDMARLKQLLAFGIPLVPASMAQWFIDLSDRYFLRSYRSLAEVGVYSLGYKIGFVVMILLVAPFQLAWPTISFRAASKESQHDRPPQQFYAKSLTYFLLVGLVMMLGLSLFAKELIMLFSNPEFIRGSDVVWIVALSYVFYGAHFVVSPGIHLTGHTKMYPWLLIGPALLNIVLNYFLISPFGMLGAAYATLISFIVMFVATYVVSNRLYPVTYEWKRISLLVVCTLVALGASVFVPANNLIISTALKFFIVLCFGCTLFFYGFFQKQEIESIKKFIQTFIQRKQGKNV